MREPIEIIQEAYEQARQAQKRAHGAQAPEWRSLPAEIREVMIELYFAGRHAVLREDGKIG
jgi:hypothetical protein